MYKVTIITSIYKSSKYLDGFLENITSQTIFKDCELYLINGNSPEYKIEESIIDPYLKSFNNIRYERLDKDPGIYACWNLMIKNSNSSYITNANTDDRIMEDCIEKHINILDNNPNIDVVYCYNIRSHVPNTQPWMIVGNEDIFPTAPFSKQLMLQANLPHNHPVWRRSLHDKFGYFEEKKYVSGSDWDFWLRCTSQDSQMQLIPEKLGIYYQNPDGMSTKQENMDRNLKEVQMIREHYLGIIK